MIILSFLSARGKLSLFPLFFLNLSVRNSRVLWKREMEVKYHVRCGRDFERFTIKTRPLRCDFRGLESRWFRSGEGANYEIHN